MSGGIYENHTANCIASKAALTSAFVDPFNPDNNARIPKSIRQIASQESGMHSHINSYCNT